jgi:hypothetical protein
LYAAFSALSTVLKYFGKNLETELLQGIVTACSESFRKNATNLRPLIRNFLFHAALNARDAQWDGIAGILFSAGSECTAQTVALMLQNSRAARFCSDFAQLIVGQLQRGQFSEEEAAALVTVLYGIAPAEIIAIVQIISGKEPDLFVHFKLTVFRRALLHCQDWPIADPAFAFATRHFRQGGLALFGQLLVRYPALVVSRFSKSALDEVAAAIDDSVDLAKSTLQFLALLLFQARHDSRRFEFANAADHAAFAAVLKWGRDKKHGKEMAIEAMRVLRDTDLVASAPSLRIFAGLPQPNREKIVRFLEGIASAAKPAAPKLALRRFSGNTRPRRGVEDGEWQALETDS